MAARIDRLEIGRRVVTPILSSLRTFSTEASLVYHAIGAFHVLTSQSI